MFNVNNLIKKLLIQKGIDPSFHPISTQVYNGPKVAFIHIAKCGGMSVDKALRQAIALPNQRRIDREMSIAASMASFGQPILSAQDSVAFSRHHANNLSAILAYFLSKQWQYVSGHVTVNTEVLNQYQRDYAFVTVLRDPVKRYISNYIYNKLTNHHPFMLPNTEPTDDLISEAESIMSSERGWQLANTQTMFLTGRYPKDKIDAKHMQPEVLNNLSKFSIVGFLEHMESFEDKCSKLLSREINIAKINTQEAASKGSNTTEAQAILTQYFNEPATQKQLAHICHYELDSYQRLKENYLR